MKIGFKNFRKFDDFPMIELGGCTFLVGSNNSGKSTLIKAAILLQNNRLRRRPKGLSDPLLWDFSFASKEVEHLYLGDFLSNLQENSEDKTITFMFESGDTEFKFILDGSSIKENDSSVLVPLKEAVTYNHHCDITFKWHYEDSKSGLFQCSYNPKGIINWFKHNKALIRDDNKPLTDDQLVAIIEELSTNTDEQTITEKFFSRDCNLSYKNAAVRNDLLTQYLVFAKGFIFYDFSRNANFIYVEAHNASHKVLLNPEDKNDYLAQTVHKYNGEIGTAIIEDTTRFVEKWMRTFKIGYGYEIKSFYNEAYTVDILDGKGGRRALGNYGTGTIQLFILFFQIAIAYAVYAKKSIGNKIVFYIEEPEQNLHPALQSKLADMFYEVWKESEGRINFVVETHSEYLVRHTQVIAAREIDNGTYTTEEWNEAMKVYYFPEEGLPYLMGYRPNGHFERQFGKGFYDEAGNSTRELYRIDRGIK